MTRFEKAFPVIDRLILISLLLFLGVKLLMIVREVNWEWWEKSLMVSLLFAPIFFLVFRVIKVWVKNRSWREFTRALWKHDLERHRKLLAEHGRPALGRKKRLIAATGFAVVAGSLFFLRFGEQRANWEVITSIFCAAFAYRLFADAIVEKYL